MNPVWDSIVWSCKSQIIGNLSLLIFCLTVGEQKRSLFFKIEDFFLLYWVKETSGLNDHTLGSYMFLSSARQSVKKIKAYLLPSLSVFFENEHFFSRFCFGSPMRHFLGQKHNVKWNQYGLHCCFCYSALSSCSDPFPQEPMTTHGKTRPKWNVLSHSSSK